MDILQQGLNQAMQDLGWSHTVSTRSEIMKRNTHLRRVVRLAVGGVQGIQTL